MGITRRALLKAMGIGAGIAAAPKLIEASPKTTLNVDGMGEMTVNKVPELWDGKMIARIYNGVFIPEDSVGVDRVERKGVGEYWVYPKCQQQT